MLHEPYGPRGAEDERDAFWTDLGEVTDAAYRGDPAQNARRTPRLDAAVHAPNYLPGAYPVPPGPACTGAPARPRRAGRRQPAGPAGQLDRRAQRRRVRGPHPGRRRPVTLPQQSPPPAVPGAGFVHTLR